MTRNVVLVVMDTARAMDVFPPDGPAVAPNLASIADEGVRFPEAVAPAPWTLPSHASLFTGTYPSKHGAHAGHRRLDDSLAVLPAAFRAAGYETVAVSNNTWISGEFGFDRGFERFQKTWQYVQTDTDLGRIARTTQGRERIRALVRSVFDGNPLVNAANAVYGQFFRKRHDSGARRTNEWVSNWLDDRDRDRPFFLFVNYLEPHLEYRPSERFARPYLPDGVSYEEAMAVPQEAWAYVADKLDLDERDFAALRGLYRGEIAYLDERIADLRAALAAHDAWEDTVVVVTSDHGENVGDHGLMDHQYCLYETLLDVPLVIRGGPFAGGRVDDALVSLVDLAPTLLDAAGVDGSAVREQSQGRSLVPDTGQSGVRDASPDGSKVVGAPPEGPRDDPRVSESRRVFAEYLAPQPSMAALEERVGPIPDEVYRYDRSLRAVRTPEWKLIRGSDGTRECYRVDEDPHEGTDLADERPDRVEELHAALDEWLAGFEHADADGDVAMSEEARRRLEDLGYLQE